MALVVVQVKDWLALYVPSPADTVAAYGLMAASRRAGVPVIEPVLVLITRPLGRPVAL